MEETLTAYIRVRKAIAIAAHTIMRVTYERVRIVYARQ